MTQALTVLPILRRSAMQTAESCLYRYKKIWVDAVPDQSDLALKGIGFHSCAHRYIERLVAEQLQADEEEAKAAFVEGIAAALTPAHLVPEVRAIFMPWAEHFGMDLPWFLAAEEHQIGKTDQTFTPDLVYGRPTGLEIVDFKTFWHPLTDVQIRGDFQARWYMFNAMRIWPNFPKYTFTHSYVRFGKQISVDFTQADFETFSHEVEAVAATIAEAQARNDWPATAGKECAFCELRCPLADNPAIVPKRFTLPQQAITVASWILAAETQLKTAKKALKAYCAANGAVDVQGIEFDNRPVMQRTYPIEDVIRILQARSIFGAFDKDNPAAGGLTISHSALAKLIKAFPQLETDLLPFQQTKETYRFSAKKPGVGDDEDES